MAEEQKTEELNPVLKEDDTKVTISQDKLNSLINEKFKKGAEKANQALLESLGVESIESLKTIMEEKAKHDEAQKSELEKAQDLANKTAEDNKALAAKYAQLEQSNKLTQLAAKHGITEVDYFKLEYDKNKDTDGFDPDTFINGLKENKQFLFGQSVKAPKTDLSGNNSNDPTNLKNKLQGMSLDQLRKYQQTL